MSGTGLSEQTELRLTRLFPPDQRDEVRRLLRDECGNNLPFCQDSDAVGLERVRFGVLKLSDGDLNKLRKAVQLAKQDWRDLLVASGFAHDVSAHKTWMP